MSTYKLHMLLLILFSWIVQIESCPLELYFSAIAVDISTSWFSPFTNYFVPNYLNKAVQSFGLKLDNGSRQVEFQILEPGLMGRFVATMSFNCKGTESQDLIARIPQIEQKWKVENPDMQDIILNFKVGQKSKAKCPPVIENVRGFYVLWHSSSFSTGFVSFHTILCPFETKNIMIFMSKVCGPHGWRETHYSKCSYPLMDNASVEDKLKRKSEYMKLLEKVGLSISNNEPAALNSAHELAESVLNNEIDTDFQDPYMCKAVLDSFSTILQNTDSFAIIDNNDLRLFIDKIANTQKPAGGKFEYKSEYLQMMVLSVSNIKEKEQVSFALNQLEDGSSDLTITGGEEKKKKNSNEDIILPIKSIFSKNKGKIDKSKESLSLYILQDAKLFINMENVTEDYVSNFTSSPVYTISISGVSTESLDENIQLVFTESSKYSVSGKICVFWKNGTWSKDGCTTVVVSDTKIKCVCNHLSSFALMNMEGLEQEKERLNWISIAGCAISSASLLMTLLIYTSFKIIRCEIRSKILIFICFNILLANLLFVINSVYVNYAQPALKPKRSLEDYICKAIGILLHYFLLSSLFWMVANAYFMYMAVTRIFSSKSHVLLQLFSFAMLGPFLLIIPTAAWDLDGNYTFSHGLCWLNPTATNYTFVLPVGLMTVNNLCVFIIIMFRIHRARRRGSVFGSTFQLKATLTMTMLLGLTWSFAFISVDFGRVVFAYLFVTFNSLQGFFIFLFYCVLKPEVRLVMLNCVRCRSNSRVVITGGTSFMMTTKPTYEMSKSRVTTGGVSLTRIRSSGFYAHYPSTRQSDGTASSTSIW